MRIPIDGLVTLLQVFDMARAVGFYRDVLGFEVFATSEPRVPDDFDWCLLRHGSVELMLNTAFESDTRPGAPDAERVAAHKDTALFFACPDVDGAYDALRAQGVAVRPPTIAPYGMKQLYLEDPDGYEICLQWRATAADAE